MTIRKVEEDIKKQVSLLLVDNWVKYKYNTRFAVLLVTYMYPALSPVTICKMKQ